MIAGYTGRSWPTIERWVEEKHFPARKLDGVWTSKENLIDFWIEERIETLDQSTR